MPVNMPQNQNACRWPYPRRATEGPERHDATCRVSQDFLRAPGEVMILGVQAVLSGMMQAVDDAGSRATLGNEEKDRSTTGNPSQTSNAFLQDRGPAWVPT
jgi:hypothetical protein